MKKTLIYVLSTLIVLASVSCGNEKKDPLQLFLESDVAASQNKSAQFKVVYNVESQDQGKNKFVSMVFVQKIKNNDSEVLAFRIEEEGNNIITFDGQSFIATDLKNKTQTISLKPSLAPEIASSLSQNFYMIIDTKLDTSEIRANSQNLEFAGTEDVNGEKCYKVTQKGEGHGEFKVENIYYFSTKDKLMKKYSSKIHNKENKLVQSISFEISDLKLNNSIDNKLFTQNIDSVAYKLTNLDLTHNMDDPHKAMENMESEDNGLLKTGTVAPDWTLSDPSGKKVSLSQFRGKIVLLDFWATWCNPCKMVMPALQKLHKKYADKGLVVIGINSFERDGDPVKYMKDQKYDYMLLLKGDEVATNYKVESIPSMYIIDKNGKIAHTELGAIPNLEEKLDAKIQQLLSEK